MADDKEVMDVLANQKGSELFEQAKKDYPYLADKDITFKYSPNPSDQRMLEFYHPEETERPEYMPAGKIGIEVFNPKTTPLDILGDYVSHYGKQADPNLKSLYEQFEQSLDPQAMMNRYTFHTSNLGENRPYEKWYEMTGLPELFRGYTFKQFGPEEEAKSYYTPQQLEILDKVRSYLNVQ
jgi:hypothetical protein